MAGPAVNLASILVVRKSLGRRFALIYLLTVIGFSILFGLILNAVGMEVPQMAGAHSSHCANGEMMMPSAFKLVCATVLTILIIFALIMKLIERFSHKEADPDTAEYTVEGMHCSHCEAAVVRAVEDVPGVESAKASATRNKLTVKGTASADTIRAAVEKTGYTFKG